MTDRVAGPSLWGPRGPALYWQTVEMLSVPSSIPTCQLDRFIKCALSLFRPAVCTSAPLSPETRPYTEGPSGLDLTKTFFHPLHRLFFTLTPAFACKPSDNVCDTPGILNYFFMVLTFLLVSLKTNCRLQK